MKKMSLNVAVHPQKMNIVRDVQWKYGNYPWSDWLNPRYGFEWSTNQSTRNIFGFFHWNWVSIYKKSNSYLIFEV